MAFRSEALIGTHPNIQEEVKIHKKTAPIQFSQQEINSMMRYPSKELNDGEYAYSPVGKWHMDHDILILDMKPVEEIKRITKPSRKEKLIKLIKAASMMY